MTSLPEFLWHGTSATRLETILSDGLSPKLNRERQVSLTARREIAVHFASLRAFDDGTPMVLIAVPSSDLDTDFMGPDANLMASPFGSGIDAYELGFGVICERLERYRRAGWQKSLKRCSGVIYRECIPVTPEMVDISPASLAADQRFHKRAQIELTGIEPDDSKTPVEPVFVADPLEWIRQNACRSAQ